MPVASNNPRSKVPAMRQKEHANDVRNPFGVMDVMIRPWIGLIVSNERIDGRWTGGRLDFRR